MAIRADRVGVRQDQVDIHGRVTSPSFLNELLEDLPEWTDMPVWVNGTEEVLPSNTSVPVTSPILADIAYPDIRRDNQYFTYRESPTHVDGLAKIKSIKGNTLVWNQIFPLQTINYTGSGYTLTSNNDGKFVLTVTETASQDSSINHAWLPSTTFKSGHKYILLGSDTAHGIDVYIKGYYIYMNRIWTAPSAMGANVSFIFNNLAPGTYNLYPMIFDLTAMGLDSITSVDEFTSLFPLSYYSYNQGSLLSFNGNGIKTVGKNLMNPSYIEYGKSWEGAINSLRACAYFIVPHGTYTVSIQGLGTLAEAATGVTTIPYTRKTIYTFSSAVKKFTLTVDDNNPYIWLLLRKESEAITQTDFESCGLMIEFGSSATEYEPYTSHTTNLPVSTYFPTGMKSAEDVYDEQTPVKATVRIKSSDMGSLPWTMPTSGVFQVYLSDAHIRPKVLSAFFKYFNNNFTYGGAPSYEDGTGGVNPNNQNIYYKDNNYTSVDALKSAMSGKYLNYELATPVELPTMSFE